MDKPRKFTTLVLKLLRESYEHDTDWQGERTNIDMLLGRLNWIFKNPQAGISRELWDRLANENPPYDVEYA